ncbi:non-ribosomal peptide synthetase [Amycolatopsis sp. Poz14]|uniref:non-ribosomal peptide synthetase n=1 Tax=Amycolatopsis sp. Poz14 TaxID=1447705 RepID=UPI001EE7C312|nr:non-ribosomal peptide synthetase [Amycolatopsis sp. Poz14]MCG3754387.1 amino acid adenylation domain-containing protein [Amycolatopsis sp. Poz14]
MPEQTTVESIHPLSPLQQGMLFHALYSPHDDVYVEQFSCRFDGPLDVPAFRAAWTGVVARHPALRTSFHSLEGEQPVQAVHRAFELPWTEHDWRTVELAPDRLPEFLAADRAAGIDPAAPPLHRFSLLRVADEAYVFVWTHHHLLLDGWSMPLVLSELAARYAALRRGEDADLPPVRPYQDYLTWLAEQNQAKTEEFWRTRLSGFATATPLPLRAAEAVPAQGFLSVEEVFSEESTAKRIATAQAGGLTIGTVVQAAWSLVLARFSGVSDVVHGATTSGRPPELPGVEDIVGMFINTLPVRTRVEGRRPVLEWLRETQADFAAARGHEHISLVRAQGCSDVPRGEPLFDSLVVVENFPITAAADNAFDGVAVTSVQATEQTSYPLTVVALPGRSLRLRLLCDRRWYTEETARAVVGALRAAVTGLLENLDRCVNDVPIMSDDAAAALVRKWNATRGDYPRDHSVPALVAEQTARTPDAVAVVHGEQHLTYRALAARAARLTGALRALGVTPGSCVGVFLERSPELITALLGTLRAGAAYVPLAPSYPAQRLAFMAEDSGTAVVLTVKALQHNVPDGVRTLLLDDPRTWPTGDEAAVTATANAPAYVMYTSGSTGTPKGVTVPHRAIVRLVRDTDYVSLRTDDRIAFAATTAFDAATFELWGALLSGAAAVVVAKQQALDPVGYAALIREQAITTLFMTTALFNQFAAGAPDAFAPMRQVLFGGEAVDPAAVRTVLAAGAPRRLLHVYGPTESTTFATWHMVDAVGDQDRTVPIGTAIANTTAYVLDRAARPVPAGAAGELCLGGDGLAHGYRGHPAQTAERFLPDPFGPPGSRLYRTGDLVRTHADGAIVFLGRTDHQVKLRGFRIELDEVAAALRAADSVADAAVLLREDVPGNPQLVAYVTGAPPLAELRAHCARTMPDHMIPAVFVPMPSLPLTDNGKLDRKALPAPECRADDADPGYVAPRPGTEELVAELWAHVLHVDRVSRDANFFDLGGHSLTATQLQTRLRRAFAADVPLRAIFTAADLADLSAEIDALRRDPAVASTPPRPVDRTTLLPLSFPQRRLWFLEQWEPGTALYHISGALRLRGRLDVPALRAAWQAVVDRHEVLRTHVSATSADDPRQTVASRIPAAIPVVDVTAAEAREVVRAVLETPFRLTEGPLWRLMLVRTSPEEHIFALCLHHLIADGESIGLLLHELGAQYRARGRADLPALPVQYGDYAAWQHRTLTDDRLAADLAYWRETLSGLPSVTLPTDRPRSADAGAEAARRAVALPSEVDGRLGALCRQAGVTRFMALYAAFAAALAQTRDLSEVVVGTPTANRDHQELEGLIGFFVNTLVLRLDLGGDPAFRDLLGRTRETCLGAYAHQAVPFERLVTELTPDRAAGRLPLFQTWFVVQDAPAAAEAFPGIDVSPAGDPDRLARYDLRLDVQRSGGETRAVFEYKAALFEPAAIARLARRFVTVLELVTADPEIRLSAVTRRLAESEDRLRRERKNGMSLAGLHRLKNTRRADAPERRGRT